MSRRPDGVWARHVCLPDSAEAPRAARRVVAETLAEAGIGAGDLPDLAVLLTSELVTNGYRHADVERAGDRVFWFAVRLTWESLTVSLTDPDPDPPQVHGGSPTSVGGRGMWIIAAQSKEWGCEPHGAGKRVWFSLDLAAVL